MVHAIINIEDEEQLLEPELRPEYLEKLQKIKKQRGLHFKHIVDLRDYIHDKIYK